MLPRATGRLETALAATALLLAVFGAFGPALDAGFVNWDDPRLLLENPHYRGLWREHLSWMVSTSWMGPYQPLSWLTLAVDHELWGLSGPREFSEARRWHAAAVLAFLAAALRLFARAAPGGLDPWPALGQARAAEGDLAGGAAAYARALELDAERPAVWFQLARTLERLGRRDEALAAVERTLALEPAHRGAREARQRLQR